ncbi:MAG TPA: hypothetical protein VFT45_16105 [Longimicrobium sp.]|nr:hypothetical protein [Longimicrobium sp.]
MSQRSSWTVTTSGDQPIHDVAKKLKEHGFEVGEVIAEFKSILGSASDDVAEAVKGVAGVADVQRAPKADVGPPGASITW